ncbi:PREDICTED: inositol 1,4,5-trisphosphate receptor-interacting protein-like 1 [Calidris pugnax]|uniref:inositol 1,4,5-trisphosphate receptor-interacting protein-like 1 n=1 Tax=Calidris pugnax TaxID=198806 RepID=UPI00071D2424|nr:PREDICTED: inositol 1,4,5-trisphosphate receptor-interacting protein-like 1 [Calidris pugnax]
MAACRLPVMPSIAWDTPGDESQWGGGFIKGASRQLPQYGLGQRRVRFKAMASMTVRVLLLLSFFLRLPMVGHELEEDTQEDLRLREEEATQLRLLRLRSLKQRNEELSRAAWNALLLAPFQHWHLWAVAGVFVLLLGLCCWLRKRSRQPESGCQEETTSCGSTEDEEEASKGEDSDDEGHLVKSLAKRVRGALVSVAYKRRVAEDLVSDLLGVFQARLANSFFPVLEPAIGVGSAFEGWDPRGHDAVYRLLVPLKPPRGHTFHLEQASAEKMPAKNRIRVQLQCTCMRGQGVGNMLCFVHQPEEALRTNQDSNLLNDLCTSAARPGFYLDVQKIARWVQTLVSSAWGEMAQWHHYSMKVLPSRRSCKLQLTNACGRSLFVELMFGVQQGDSDIFLSSQVAEHPGCFIPGTTWAESYAVAEAKFFRHVAKQAPQDSFHLTCLQLCAGILEGTSFSTDTWKTVGMHLLNTLPPASWTRREFVSRMQDIMWDLRKCLEEKRLDHFFLGNENMPEDIALPPAFQAAEPLNLFQCLVQDPAAHAKALRELEEVQAQLRRLLFYGA